MKQVEESIKEAKRFLKRAKLYKTNRDSDDVQSVAEFASMKRSSMDLSRALAQLRKAGVR